MFVLICHCGGTCLIRILHSKMSKWSKYQKNCLFILQLPFMANIKHLHCFEYITIAITLHGCVIHVQDLFFDVNSTVIGLTCFGNFEN